MPQSHPPQVNASLLQKQFILSIPIPGVYLSICNCRSAVGTSTPPTIAATPVPALPPPIAVNSYPPVPAPPNGQSASETLYTNGIHTYQGEDSSSSFYYLLYYIVELHEKCEF